MIEKMRKYTFLIFHLDYQRFLENLQKLGMVHIEKSTKEKTEQLLATRSEIEQYTASIRLLKHYLDDKSEILNTNLYPLKLRNQIDTARSDKEKLQHTLNVLDKQIKELSPWGDFDWAMIDTLRKEGIYVHLYSCLHNRFKPEWNELYPIEILNQDGNTLYFALISKDTEPPIIEADPFIVPKYSLLELRQNKKETLQKLTDLEQFFKEYALTGIKVFEEEIIRLSSVYDFEEAKLQAVPEADEHVMLLKGWIPLRLEKELTEFLKDETIVYIASDPTEEDNVPILLRNNRFARLFEPISKMYMLPHYHDMDMTPFLAPFFTMFFGFCNADMGYGVILILLAIFLKSRNKNPGFKGFMNLIMVFGSAAIIMGFVMGTVLAFDMKQMAFVKDYILITETNQIFNFALLLGAIQILFGILLNAIKKIINGGIKNGLSTIGTFLFIFGLAVTGSLVMGAKPSIISQNAKYPIYLGLGLILLFNNPKKNVLINVGGGIWALYNIVTGFFGDILSYIRLFALGVSGGILGIVINSMAHQFSSVPIIGPVIFLVFMVFGHSLNLALGSLGGFVHPMRLTFVEFFKNAEFSGPGLEYNPLKYNKIIK